MRIIAGNLRGRQFQTPHGHRTHPMGDKIRGALFNVLGDIDGLSFLDAFCGSGALAYEAASRGAQSVIAIDIDQAAYAVTKNNVQDLNLLKKVKVIKAHAGGWSIHNMEKKFDIVLLAPPYDDLQPQLLKTLAKRHVKKNGLAVIDWPGKAEPLQLDKFEQVSIKNYGDAQLVFYRKIK